MEEAIFIKGIKEAAPVGWNGSYADEGNCQSWRLPVTVVGSHINLSAIDHSKMASDINRFPSCILALCAKALSNAYVNVVNVDFHMKMLIRMLESQERLVKSTSSAFFLKKVEHLQICKCSKLTSIKERTLKAQHFPMQRYGFFQYDKQIYTINYGRVENI
ncbi:MAG: hypothetical protein ACI3ZN_04975 [Candidatus Cryptobacteroides sp.]